jgi:hypothetical protein
MAVKKITEKKQANKTEKAWKPFGLSKIEFFNFEMAKPEIGKINVAPFPYKGKNKFTGKDNPEHCLTFNGIPCQPHYQLLQLAQAIIEKKLKPNTEARITFVEEKKLKGKQTVNVYTIETK